MGAEGCDAFFDPLSPGVAGVLGDQDTAARRKWRADLS
jgi:hypothetical protein